MKKFSEIVIVVKLCYQMKPKKLKHQRGQKSIKRPYIIQVIANKNINH